MKHNEMTKQQRFLHITKLAAIGAIKLLEHHKLINLTKFIIYHSHIFDIYNYYVILRKHNFEKLTYFKYIQYIYSGSKEGEYY